MQPRLAFAFCLLVPMLGGCAVFVSSQPEPLPELSGAALETSAWRDDIQRTPDGDMPEFVPLVDAQNAVEAAKAQPGVNNYDSQSLSQAEQSLDTAQQAWQKIAGKKKPKAAKLAKVADAAHRAERLAQIAQYTAIRERGLQQLNQLGAQQTLAAEQNASAQLNPADRKLVNQRVVPTMLGSLTFQQGTARLTSDSRPVIGKLARLMKQHPNLGVAIFGFTDNSTPPESQLNAFVNANPQLAAQNPSQAEKVEAYRQGLSEARARDVAQLLVNAGVNPNRIGARGLRDEHPIASNDTAAGRQRNSRAEAIMVPLSTLGNG